METKTCTKCSVERSLSEFWKSSKTPGGYKNHCKECLKASRRAWEATDNGRERIRAFEKKRKYGLSMDQFHAMWDGQGGSCFICEDPLAFGTQGHAVDHCHKTGKVRGLLCPACNLGLGKFRDNPTFLRNAATYLERV